MGWWLAPRPGRFTPGKETRYPLYRRLGGPHGRSGRVWKISPIGILFCILLFSLFTASVADPRLRPLGHWDRLIGIRAPDRLVRSESLYRLRYLGPQQMSYKMQIIPLTEELVAPDLY